VPPARSGSIFGRSGSATVSAVSNGFSPLEEAESVAVGVAAAAGFAFEAFVTGGGPAAFCWNAGWSTGGRGGAGPGGTRGFAG
jgi:hypothetical protein